MTIEQVEEAIFRKGFGKEHADELRQQVAEGKTDIILQHAAKVEKDDVAYNIHIRNDVENEQIYLNKFAVAVKLADHPGEQRNHTFSAERMITAMEAYRMLKYGDLVAVNKDLFKDGEKYNTWLSIDLDKPKDEYGNYHVNSYHENYYRKRPFDIQEQLAEIATPVKQLENQNDYPNMEKSLKKANLIPVDIILNGQQTKGYLGVNPAKGEVLVYDSNLVLAKEKTQHEDIPQKADATVKVEDEKKKSVNNHQRVNWKNNQSNRGIRY